VTAGKQAQTDDLPVYVFRTKDIAKNETVATAAPLDVVVSVFGGGGLKGAAGLEAVFGGSVYFQNEETGAAYLGVWGSRKGGHFRSRLRQAGVLFTIVKEPPPARFKWFSTAKRGERPVRKVILQN